MGRHASPRPASRASYPLCVGAARTRRRPTRTSGICPAGLRPLPFLAGQVPDDPVLLRPAVMPWGLRAIRSSSSGRYVQPHSGIFSGADFGAFVLVSAGVQVPVGPGPIPVGYIHLVTSSCSVAEPRPHDEQQVGAVIEQVTNRPRLGAVRRPPSRARAARLEAGADMGGVARLEVP